jgi:hypothetical protein
MHTRPRHQHTLGVSRREFLQVGYSGLLGLGLVNLVGPAVAELAPADRPGGTGGRAKSLILVFLSGGPSHLDTFDLKPEAPAEVRGEFQSIATRVPGIRISEHLPMLAKRMDRVALVRSMTHRNTGHLPATHWLLTGRAIPGIPENLGVDKIASRTDWPCYASAVDYFRPRHDGKPNGVHLPTYLEAPPLIWPGQDAGCLGAQYDPWQIRDDPNSASFRVRNLSLPSGFTLERLRQRRSLLACVNAQQDRLSRLAETRALGDQQQAAFTLLTSSRFAAAFEMTREPDAVRERYGRHTMGQSLLLARRLVEAGVPVVQANMGVRGAWDTHGDNWNILRDRLLPLLDRAVSALLDDLQERRLLDQTLVIVVGEFGRAPRISSFPGEAKPGRDHWAEVFSACFAGAGVRGGQVIGASDALGGSPAGRAFTPDDLGATVYHSLGLDPGSQFIDREGRPQRLNNGRVIDELYSGREA